MKKTLLITLTIFLFSCQKEDNTINTNDSLLSQKAYYTMLKDINFQFEIILNESKPKDLSIEEYKTALISGKIGLSSSQQNKILNATKPLIDYSNKLAKINSLSIDDLGSKIALGGMYSPNDNLNSKYNAKSFQAYNESSIIKSNALDSKQIMRIDNSEILDCALTALGADAIFALSASSITSWGAAAMTKAFGAVAKRFLGPAGVAIAVITFGICIHHESLD
jgi:hypothetical protein